GMPVDHGEVEAKLKGICLEISASEDWLSFLEDLTRADYYFIGHFIQTYCVSDLNARQLVNCFKYILYGEEADFTEKLNDAAVLVELEKLADIWPLDQQTKTGVIKATIAL